MGWRTIFRWKSPERDLATLVADLKNALGPQLANVILYGSMASGEFQEKHSDVNVLILFSETNYGVLRRMGPAIKKWIRKGHAMPILVARSELADFAANFPIEFLDMVDHHRLYYGENPLETLKVDVGNLYFQCEHELELHQLKLRQAVAASDGQARKLREILVRSLPGVLTLFRAVLRMEGNPAKLGKMEAARELAQRLGFDASSLERLHAMRSQGEAVNLDEVAAGYLLVISRVLEHLRKQRR